jgi:hypothetical protein
VESLLFMLNSIAVVVMVYMALRDERRPPGTPQTSVFRTLEDNAISPPAPAAKDRRGRIAKSRAR